MPCGSETYVTMIKLFGIFPNFQLNLYLSRLGNLDLFKKFGVEILILSKWAKAGRIQNFIRTKSDQLLNADYHKLSLW